MSIPELFKYNVIISNTLFLGVALSMGRRISGYSFSTHTISKSILFLRSRGARAVFRLNFLLKAILDLGFWWFLIYRGIVVPLSLPSILILIAVVFFGALTYFSEEKSRRIHLFLIYTVAAVWGLAEFLLALGTGVAWFIYMSIPVAGLPFGVAVWSLVKHRTNVYVQLFCVGLVYVWLFIYTGVFV